MAATITVSADSTMIKEVVRENDTILFDGANIHIFANHTNVFINGDLVGVHAAPAKLYAILKEAKRTGKIHVYTGVVWNVQGNYISVCTDGGRCVRPLYVVDGEAEGCENNTLRLTKDHIRGIMDNKLSWNDLVSPEASFYSAEYGNSKSVIEYMDVEETNHAMIAMKFKDLLKGQRGNTLATSYTNLEIHPSLMFGILASNIPFPDHNQAPRNCYQTAMGKQAIGIYATSFRTRMDTLGNVLNYPQRPLISTRVAKHLNCNEMPSGMNVIVAIATFTGYNQEDSIIMNKSAVDRGFFNSTFYRSYKEHCIKNHSTGEEEVFCKPDTANTKGLKPFNYDKLEEDGFAKENTYVETGDVLIGKCMPQKVNDVFVYKDNSIVVKNNEMGYVDRNCAHDRYFKNVNSDGYVFCKTRVRNYRSPVIGDKFSSRHGQKGTVGMLYTQADMPFSINGISPDIIINPHAIPSRMTIAQLMECIMGKACVQMGTYGDGTPFTDLGVEDIADMLQNECKMERYGNEILHNPRTGEQLPTMIFMGPTYYQRLKHMVADKVHGRGSNGPVVLLTRQPAEGRAREGGLRMGEMEVECNWGHGSLHFLKERLMDCSDNYRIFVCSKCGMMSNVNPDKNIYDCKACKNKSSFVQVRIPYACKLLFQEIQCMGIGTKLLTQ
jgi:DNA-directed RNA polymerase II subunit RPB2